MNNERKFNEVIKPEDRLSEELLDDILGGAECRTGKVTIECDPSGYTDSAMMARD